MSFSYSMTLDSGVVVTYWELYSGNVDRIQKTVTWQIGGWLDATARNSGKAPVIVLRFNKSGSDYPLTPNGPAEAALITLFEGLSQQQAPFVKS